MLSFIFEIFKGGFKRFLAKNKRPCTIIKPVCRNIAPKNMGVKVSSTGFYSMIFEFFKESINTIKHNTSVQYRC